MIKEFHESKNLLNASTPSETTRTTVTSLSNGGIELSISNATWTNCRYANIPVVANVEYTLSIYIDEYSGTGTFMIPFRQIDGNGTVISTDTITQTGTKTHTFTAEGSTVWLSLYLNNSGTVATASAKIRIMLNEGSTALPYEPFETDNLFNEVYPNIASNVQKVEISVPNGEYTLSTTAPLNNNDGANLFLLKGNDSPSTSGNGVWNEQSRTITITDGVLKIGYRSIQGVNPENYKTMLNTGSTALPYVPYGDTWNTKSYVKSITGARTYTKFPIVLRTTEQSIPTWNVKGNMQQSGTPTPTSPITPSECGVRTENLFNTFDIVGQVPSTGNGALVSYNGSTTSFIPINSGEVVVTKPENVLIYLMLYAANGDYIGYDIANVGTTINGSNISGYENARFARLRIDRTTDLDDIQIMFNKGSTAKPYEPYGYKIPVISGNTTTNIYLSEPLRKINTYYDQLTHTGLLLRGIKKLVLTGEENWGVSSGTTVYYVNDIVSDYLHEAKKVTVCSHFDTQINTNSASNIESNTLCFRNSSDRLYINSPTHATTTDFTTFLQQQYAAGTPVTVWYVLATPLPQSTTPSAIPTTSGLNTIDVNTTLKPSEMSLTFDGYKLCKRQRYSRTENLWNEDYTGISSDVIYKPVYVGDGTFTLSTTCPRSSDPAPCLFFLSGNVDSGASSAVNGVWNESNGIRNSQNGYVTIAYRKLGITNPENFDTMLNTGSTAKPYQPYLDWE